MIALPDAEALADLTTFVARAHAVAPAGSVRLQGVASALVCSAGILDGQGLLGAGCVIGVRVLALGEPCDDDVTMTSARLLPALTSTRLDLDADPMPPRWTALSPPRSGWEPVGTIPGSFLHDAARSRDVYVPVPDLEGLPHGAALAVRALGFLDEEVQLLRAGSWRRLTTAAGHVVTRL